MKTSFERLAITGIRAHAIFFVVLALLMSMPPTARAVSIGEFPIFPAYTQSGISSGLAADSAGNVWFTDTLANNRIGRITPAGDVSVFDLPPFGQLTGGITAGADGSIWVTKAFGAKILRIIPAGTTVTVTEFPASTDTVPIDSLGDIVAGGDGNLWFTGGNRIGRMTTAGEIAFFSPPTPFSSPGGITAGPDGNVWFTEIAAGKIGRITPEGVITEFPRETTPGDPSQPFAITTGPDGNLWFTDNFSDGISIFGRIGRITPAGVVTKFPIPDPTQAGSHCYGIAAGPDDNIWFAINNRDSIGRITPTGVFLPELAVPTAGAVPQKIVASPDGLLWFTESNTNKIGIVSLDELTGYLPLNTGTSWTYQENGVAGYMRTVADVVGGVARIIHSDGYEMYMSSDANGIRDHKEFDNDLGVTSTFSPPLVFADSRSAPGFPVSTYGTVTMTDGTVTTEYSAISTLQGFETITVPAGTFRTARIFTTVNFVGIMATSQTNWVAPGVGIVKGVADEDYGISTYLLTATSIRDTTPDRFLFEPRFFLAPGSIATSSTVTVTGITVPAPIAISGGEYRIGSGNFTASPGTVTNGQTVTVRQTASSAFGTQSAATLTTGGFSAPFRVTTWPRPVGADLSRAIAGLKLMAGMDVPDGQSPADATGDGQVGLAEALIILQQLSGLRR